MAFTAGAFGYARRDRYMRLEKTLHIDREGQQIDATESTVRLFPERDEPDYLELRGGSKITGGPKDKAMRSMSATDINIDLRRRRPLDEKTRLLAGNAAIELAPQQGTAGQKLSGNYMDIGLEPDGSVRNISTRDNVTAALPATKDTSARTIKSTAMTAAGNAQGLNRMIFTEGVEYREAATKTQAPGPRKRRHSRRRSIPGGHPAGRALHGNFDFTDGPMRAVSNDASYNVTAGTLALTGKEITPEIRDESLTLLAETIDVTLDPRKMTAKGNVRSTLLPPKKAAANTPATKRPALLGDKDPVSILSAALSYDEANKIAEYTGQTRLFQGATSINADKLTLDETKGDLTATGKVITNLEITNKQAEAGAKPKPTIGRAETFTYADDTRMATYTTNAQFDGDQGHLSAAKLELQLAKTENALERLVGTGAVNATVDKRTVTGTQLTHSPADEKYVVFGAPVRMVDADCQETSGKTLTFWKASDRVLVDGNNEVRTQTKGGGKCATATPPK
jgi:lipopolysaccharide transport protein LptA